MSQLDTSISFVRQLVLNPREAFDAIAHGEYSKQILTVGCLGFLIPFYKSFSVGHRHEVDFFVSERLNRFLTLMGNPQIGVLYAYLSFFVFILLVYAMSTFFGQKQKSDLSHLVCAFVAVSVIGVVGQLLFSGAKHVMPLQWLIIGRILMLLWVLTLFSQAVRVIRRLSLAKSLISVCVPFFIMNIIPSSGLSGIAPFLCGL